ncbi:MAG: AAA family ATPase [Chitinispirillales bacterium]|jgi:energy-coupling factor transporter ATP-binding protein EcfA2|nr:AAA family ATPase [Chitinispirillales bacterium]
MGLKKISLENFTVFEKMDIALCDGINVFIGENGTGKTHLLKVLYAFCECEIRETPSFSQMGPSSSHGFCPGSPSLNQMTNFTDAHLRGNTGFLTKITGCFQTTKLEDLVRNYFNKDFERISTAIRITIDLCEYDFSIKSPPSPKMTSWIVSWNHIAKNVIPTVFIPAKEMLTHSGLENDFTQRNLPFDDTLIDILFKAGVSTLKNLPDDMLAILEKIAQIIGGKVLYENKRYYVQKPNGVKIDFAVEAEGFKKLGLIYRLIETGNIKKGSVLIWDEPESNINPKNIPFIVDILLELQKSGIQVFIATHDYFLAKYINVKKTKSDAVLFHALYKSNDVIHHECDEDFTMLENNSILTQSVELYKDGVRKVME